MNLFFKQFGSFPGASKQHIHEKIAFMGVVQGDSAMLLHTRFDGITLHLHYILRVPQELNAIPHESCATINHATGISDHFF